MGFVNDAGIKAVAFLVIYRKRNPNMAGEIRDGHGQIEDINTVTTLANQQSKTPCFI
jgi:hypothetical protein